MSKEKSTPITIGTRVEFDSDDGPQSGVVAAIRAHIGNGQRIALIRVPGTIDNAPWRMPVDELQRAAVPA